MKASNDKQNLCALNDDFLQRVTVLPQDYFWRPSPISGVTRMVFDSVGIEHARTTCMVRFAPGAAFTAHHHPGGEEFLVIDGMLEDEYGCYPEGTYVRNPIGTSHTPHVGPNGATLFVKLQQFSIEDDVYVQFDTHQQEWLPGVVEGLEVMPLHEFDQEQTALIRWPAHTQFPKHEHVAGEEVLILEGKLLDEHGEYPAGSWFRNPPGSSHAPFTLEDGALLWVKSGHL